MATLIPEFDQFAKAYQDGQNQVVYARLAADLDTPVSLMLKLTGAQKDAFMLESVTGGEVRGRYSIIGMKPDTVWKCHDGTASINREARFDPDAFEPCEADPLTSLRQLIDASRIELPEDLPQSAAGLFLSPVTWLMGIPWSEAIHAGALLGKKTILNEIIAFIGLAELKEGVLSEKSRLIMTYALCGFANLSSIGIQIGGIGTMVPERKQEIIRLGFKAMIAGTVASCISGTIIGVLYSIG